MDGTQRHRQLNLDAGFNNKSESVPAIKNENNIPTSDAIVMYKQNSMTLSNEDHGGIAMTGIGLYTKEKSTSGGGSSKFMSFNSITMPEGWWEQ